MERDVVEKESVIYTCNCGWVDVGHANTKSYRFGEGARSLWDQILSQNGKSSKAEDGFKVFYQQKMGKVGVPVFGDVLVGPEQSFFVARSLNRQEQESVALGIFLYMTYKFEDFQGSFPGTGHSSYSIEDVVSNVLGFYNIVRGTNWRRECGVVGKDASLKVFDNYKEQINRTRVATPSPIFFDCSECKSQPKFPSIFKSINVLSPKMKDFYINRTFQYGSKSRKWIPIDDGLELRSF